MKKYSRIIICLLLICMIINCVPFINGIDTERNVVDEIDTIQTDIPTYTATPSEDSIARDSTVIADTVEDPSSADEEVTDGTPDEELQEPVYVGDIVTDEDNINAGDLFEDPTNTESTNSTNAATSLLTQSVTRDDGKWYWPAASTSVKFSDYAGCFRNCHQNDTYCGHNGVDFSNGTGAVYASRSGTFYCSNINYNYRGIYAVIEHPIENSNYSYYSIYQHLTSGSVMVTNNSTVSAGQQIATSGGTGGIETYSNHLHFAIIIATKGKGDIISRFSELNTIENKGWIYDESIPNGEGRLVANPKYPSATNPFTLSYQTSETLTGFINHPGSITYTNVLTEVGNPSTPAIDYNRLEFNLNGGAFEEDSSLYKGTAASFSNTYVHGSSIICATSDKNITLTSYATAIAVDMTGKVTGALQWQNNGTLTVPPGGFVIAVSQGSNNTILYDNVWNAAYNYNNGNARYVWYDPATKDVYISNRYIDFGAYTGNMYTQGTSIGITERIPVKEGYLFCGWKTADGMVYCANTRVALTEGTTTLTAYWNKKLVFDTNGGAFEDDSSLLKGTADSFSNTFIDHSVIICNTYNQTITPTKWSYAIAVDMTGKITSYLKYKKDESIRVPYGGFVICVSAHNTTTIPLKDHIYSAIINHENGIGQYIWYETDTMNVFINVYLSNQYIDYGAYNGYQYTIGTSTGITDRIPVKDGFVFCGWKTADGMVYRNNTSVDLPTAITTLTAQWYKKLIINTNGGAFEGENSLLMGTADSISNTFIDHSAILCTTYKQKITPTKASYAIAIDMTGKITSYLKYKKYESISVPYGGFVICVSAHNNNTISLRAPIYTAIINHENGIEQYLWYDSATRNVYISTAPEDFGAYTGTTYTIGNSIVLPDTSPTKEGYTFCGWLADDTAVYPANGTVTLNSAITTLTAIWNEEE